MSFSTYQDMKPSGVSSIGEIPSHWECLRLRSISGSPLSNGVGEASDRANPDDPRYIRITDISTPRSLRSDTFRSLPSEIAEKALIAKGDILLAAVGATFGKSYLHDSDAISCYAGYLVRFRAAQGILPEFVSYFTESCGYWDQLNSNVIQSTVQNFSASRYGEVRTAVPPHDEQIAIAAFLDHETGKIDDLIAEQEQLIALLDEKRQAVISHAVTKGLDPDVEMKDSGIEWLGKVPAHWELKPIKTLASIKGGSTPSPADANWNGDIVWYSPSDLTSDKSDYVRSSARMITEEGLRSCNANLTPPDSVILSTRAPIGSVKISDLQSCTNQGCKTLVPMHTSTKHLYYILLSATGELNLRGRGTTFLEISGDALGRLVVPLPPKHEREVILEEITRHMEAMRLLQEESRKTLILLKERRSALISAAVTGKIDVRNHPAAVAATNENKDN